MYLSRTWLKDSARMGNYVGYTRRQLQQGSVIKGVETIKAERDAAHDEALRMLFWEQLEAQARIQEQSRQLKVVGGRFK